jgi:type I restriction enzyme R subunit
MMIYDNFDKVLEDKFQDIIETNFLLFQRFNDDLEFKEFVSTKMFEFVNHNISSNTQHY